MNDCVQCPYHGFLYDGNGIAVLIPSLGKSAKINPNYMVRSFKVKEFMNFIFMWYGDKNPEEDIRWLEGIDESYSFSTIKETWEVNYTRAIENQLDVSHLPFVHRTTIGRGNRTLVNGPIVELEGDVLNVWVCNEVDMGQIPKKQNEIEKDQCTGRLQLILPNYWQNVISDKLRVMAAFVPEDENRTILYVRIYQKFINIPLISSLINYIFMKFNKMILKQDRSVVTSQIPKYSNISNKEFLVPADAPILLYRKYLHENSKD